MKNIFFVIIILLSLVFFTNSKLNILKLYYCLKNNEKFRKVGDEFLSNYKIDSFSTILSLYSKLEVHSDEYNKCELKANNSFEYDTLCVIRCLNEFKNDYDYSCLSACYY